MLLASVWRIVDWTVAFSPLNWKQIELCGLCECECCVSSKISCICIPNSFSIWNFHIHFKINTFLIDFIANRNAVISLIYSLVFNFTTFRFYWYIIQTKCRWNKNNKSYHIFVSLFCLFKQKKITTINQIIPDSFFFSSAVLKTRFVEKKLSSFNCVVI